MKLIKIQKITFIFYGKSNVYDVFFLSSPGMKKIMES